MEPAALLASELDSYFAWLTAFEANVPGARQVTSRWYRGSLLQAYTRYSWFKPSIPGVPAICVADITVDETVRGQGLLASIIERFLDGRDGLSARVLYLENVVSPRLGDWLLRAGFERCAYSGMFPTYYVVR